MTDVTPERVALQEIYEQLNAVTDAVYTDNIGYDVMHQFLLLVTGRMYMIAHNGLQGEPLEPELPWRIKDNKIILE